MDTDKQIVNYNLQQIRGIIGKRKADNSEYINIFKRSLKNMYGLFGTDNSFVFVEQKSKLFPRYSLNLFVYIDYMFNALGGDFGLFDKCYAVKDFFTKNYLSDYYEEEFEDGEIYEYNGTKYYVISPSKFISVQYLSDINKHDIGLIQDRINEFLALNPDFVNQVFFSNEVMTKKLKEDK